ncbi:hypothetical protein PG991_001107 [Apiospora marii]|uniref:Uncharacterized protein n=1 Tax=Apiospora marii TaxID=335849 RepID=A0ABR1SV80_9PEZI
MSQPLVTAEIVTIYGAATKCREAFLPCLTCAELMEMEWAENRLADFNLWANGIGAFAGSQASLDDRLRRDPETQGIVVNVLELLQGSIQQCHSLDQSSNSELAVHSGNDGSTALTAAMRDVEQLLNQLARVSVAIRNSGTASRFRKADKMFNPDNYWELRTYLENLVKCRPLGPNATGFDSSKNSVTPTQNRLIEANLKRRNRFVYAMHHSQKLALAPPQRPERTPLVMDQPNNQLSSAMPVEAPSPVVTGNEEKAPEFTETKASTLGTLPLILPSKAPPSRVVMTQITSTTAKVTYPKPPKVRMGLHQFKCPCCCQTIPELYQERTQWK